MENNMTWWESAVDNIVKIFNTPTCINGVTIGMLLIFVLVVLSRTSIGRKALKKLSAGIGVAKDELSKAKEELDNAKAEFKEFKELKEQQIAEIKSDYEVLLSGVNARKEKLEDLVLKISENLHNGKIQEEVNKYVENKEQEGALIVSNVVEEAKAEYKSDIDELRAELEALKSEVKQ